MGGNDSALETLERATGRSTKKAIVVLLRWVLVIACSGLILSSPTYQDHRLVSHLFILFLFATNVAIALVPARLFSSSYFDHCLATVDICLVSASIWYSGEVSSDVYLLYFISIVVAAMGETLQSIMWSTLLVVVVYVCVTAGVGGSSAVMHPDFFVRIPFFFVVAMFYGYFAQLVRRERGKQEEFKKKLDVTQQVRDISWNLAESLDRQEILESLVTSQRTFLKADYCAVVSLAERQILAESGEWVRTADKNKTRMLFNTLQVQLDNYLMSDTGVRSAVTITKRGRGSGISETPTTTGIQVCFTHEEFTFLPVSGNAQSDLYLCLLGNFSSDTMGYATLILWNASMALKKAGQYQELLQEVQKRHAVVVELNEALSFKTGFIKKISDELKTPVYSFIGFTELLLNGGYGTLSDEQREVMKRMLENARALRNLVNRVLDHTKFDFGDRRMFFEVGSLPDTVEQVVKSCRPLIKDKPVVIQIEGVSEFPEVTTDWDAFRQILVNLISNAVKFTESGAVTVSYSYYGDADEVAVTVEDTGTGIAESELKEVFVPFRYIDTAYQESFTGTGLGLSVNKRQAQLLGGRISVESTLGEGSAFTITLPRVVQAARKEPAEETSLEAH